MEPGNPRIPTRGKTVDSVKGCVESHVEFPDVFGADPDDFQHADCASLADSLCANANPAEYWVYREVLPKQSDGFGNKLPPTERELGDC